MTNTSQECSLNENQQRRLRVTCEHIDRVLSEIESILTESGSGAAFPTYIPDIMESQQQVVEEYITNVRARLRQTLEKQGISTYPPSIPISRAIRSRLYSIDIAAEEIKPRHMRGYGKIPPDAATELKIFTGELQERAMDLHHYLEKEKFGSCDHQQS